MLRLEYDQFVSTIILNEVPFREVVTNIGGGRSTITLTAFDGTLTYQTTFQSTNPDYNDYVANYQSNAKGKITETDDYGHPVTIMSLNQSPGLYEIRKQYAYTALANTINFFDVEATTHKYMKGAKFWVREDSVPNVHNDDYIEYSIVDKNDVLGLFGIYGLTLGTDILEISKFVRTNRVKKGSSSDGYFDDSVYNHAVRMTPGLFVRMSYVNFGTANIDFLITVYFYE